jgi:hypothetical protein
LLPVVDKKSIRVLALDSDDDASGCETDVPCSLPSISEIQKVTLERKIYLRAALKLLDQRDQILDEKTPERSVSDVIKYGIVPSEVFLLS